MKNLIIKEMKKDQKILDFILSDISKDSNFQLIHDQFSNEKDFSFSERIDDLEKLFNLKSEKIEDRKSINDFQLIMIHRESRKIYYLFIHDIKNDKMIFLSKNDSIMKNKLFLLKLIQFFDHSEMKISYLKNDRKNQSSEIISKDSREYQEKLSKYSSI